MTDTPAPGNVSLESVFRTETDGELSWLGLPLLRLLAQGRPVALEELADVTGRPIQQIRAALADQTDIEYGQTGRIVGNGITLNPTQHRFDINGHRLHTWCALDTLVFPAMLGLPARVQSPCHATGVPVRVDVEPDRVADVEPSAAVVSIVTPADRSSIRASFCDLVHFFASAQVASGWLAAHPGASLAPVAEAQDLGRSLIESLPVTGGCAVRCC